MKPYFQLLLPSHYFKNLFFLVPRVRNIRSLEHYDQAYSPGTLLRTKTESCHQKFSKER